jgi:hypothetical protein
MPKKKKAKKRSAKLIAAKGGKGSPGDAKAKAARTASTGPKATGEGAPPKVKPQEKAEPNRKDAAKKKPKADLAPLRKKAEEAKATFEKAKTQADALRAKAKDVESKAKTVYVRAVAPYRDACREAGLKCEFAGSRAQNVAPAVRFLVEKVKDGIKVAIKGKAKSEEVIPTAKLKESIGRAAFEYCERKLGPESQYGKKWAGLSNRLRAAFKTQ